LRCARLADNSVEPDFSGLNILRRGINKDTIIFIVGDEFKLKELANYVPRGEPDLLLDKLELALFSPKMSLSGDSTIEPPLPGDATTDAPASEKKRKAKR
jgi:hypothetical protein